MENLKKENLENLKIKIEELQSELEVAKEKLEFLEDFERKYLKEQKQSLDDIEFVLINDYFSKDDVVEYVQLVKELTQELEYTLYKILYD